MVRRVDERVDVVGAARLAIRQTGRGVSAAVEAGRAAADLVRQTGSAVSSAALAVANSAPVLIGTNLTSALIDSVRFRNTRQFKDRPGDVHVPINPYQMARTFIQWRERVISVLEYQVRNEIADKESGAHMLALSLDPAAQIVNKVNRQSKRELDAIRRYISSGDMSEDIRRDANALLDGLEREYTIEEIGENARDLLNRTARAISGLPDTVADATKAALAAIFTFVDEILKPSRDYINDAPEDTIDIPDGPSIVKPTGVPTVLQFLKGVMAPLTAASYGVAPAVRPGQSSGIHKLLGLRKNVTWKQILDEFKRKSPWVLWHEMTHTEQTGSYDSSVKHSARTHEKEAVAYAALMPLFITLVTKGRGNEQNVLKRHGFRPDFHHFRTKFLPKYNLTRLLTGTDTAIRAHTKTYLDATDKTKKVLMGIFDHLYDAWTGFSGESYDYTEQDLDFGVRKRGPEAGEELQRKKDQDQQNQDRRQERWRQALGREEAVTEAVLMYNLDVLLEDYNAMQPGEPFKAPPHKMDRPAGLEKTMELTILNDIHKGRSGDKFGEFLLDTLEAQFARYDVEKYPEGHEHYLFRKKFWKKKIADVDNHFDIPDGMRLVMMDYLGGYGAGYQLRKGEIENEATPNDRWGFKIEDFREEFVWVKSLIPSLPNDWDKIASIFIARWRMPGVRNLFRIVFHKLEEHQRMKLWLSYFLTAEAVWKKNSLRPRRHMGHRTDVVRKVQNKQDFGSEEPEFDEVLPPYGMENPPPSRTPPR